MTEHGKQFMDMFREELGEHHKVMPIINKMVIMLEPMEEFEEMMEVCNGVENYGDYLTEKEAEHITEHFTNFDKTHGAKWPKPEMLFDTVKSVGGVVEEPRKYNKWVLFTVMNMIHADYGGVLQTVAQGSEYAKLAYKMALAFITDPDRTESVRAYFGLEC